MILNEKHAYEEILSKRTSSRSVGSPPLLAEQTSGEVRQHLQASTLFKSRTLKRLHLNQVQFLKEKTNGNMQNENRKQGHDNHINNHDDAAVAESPPSMQLRASTKSTRLKAISARSQSPIVNYSAFLE